MPASGFMWRGRYINEFVMNVQPVWLPLLSLLGHLPSKGMGYDMLSAYIHSCQYDRECDEIAACNWLFKI